MVATSLFDIRDCAFLSVPTQAVFKSIRVLAVRYGKSVHFINSNSLASVHKQSRPKFQDISMTFLPIFKDLQVYD